MYTSVPVVISILSVLASFEVLAAMYLPDEKGLFAVTTGVGGLAATYFVSFAVADSWQSGPADPALKATWQATQWITSKEDAYRKSEILSVISAVPVAVGLALRMSGVHFGLTAPRVNWLVGAGLFLAMLGTFGGVQRTKHAMQDDEQRGIRAWEAYLTSVGLALYTFVLLIFLP